MKNKIAKKRKIRIILFGIGDVISIIGCFITHYMLKNESAKIFITDDMAHIEKMNLLTTLFDLSVLLTVIFSVLLIIEVIIGICLKPRAKRKYQMGIGMTSLMKAYIDFSNKDKLRVMEVAEELEIEEIFEH